jgi:hypothetical protein
VKRYKFYFPAAGMSGFPKKYRVGLCTIQEFSKLPRTARNCISSFRDRQFGMKVKYHAGTLQEFKKTKRKEWYFCTRVSARDAREAATIAQHNALQTLKLLKSFYLPERLRSDFGEYYYVGRDERGSEEKYLSPKVVTYHHTFLLEVEKYLRILSRLIQYKKQGEMARRCISGVDVFGMINYDTSLEVKFLLSVIATEGLLLGRDDKDFLGWKLKEKIAIILGDTPVWLMEYLGKKNVPTATQRNRYRIAARRGLAKKIGEMYEKRSRFAHQDNKTRITPEDYRFASMIFRLTLQRVLWLYSTKGIKRVNKQSKTDVRSIDGFIEDMKYSVPLGA